MGTCHDRDGPHQICAHSWVGSTADILRGLGGWPEQVSCSCGVLRGCLRESERRSGGHLGAGDPCRRGSGVEVPVDCASVGAPIGRVLSIFTEEKTGEAPDILGK